MSIEEILKFIDEESKHLIEKYGTADPTIKRLKRLGKLTEEVGELSSEVLALDKFQSARKMEKFTKESIAHEFADVIICTLLLAEACDVNIKEALSGKIEKIKARQNHK